MHCLELTDLQPLVGHLLINWSEYGMNDPNQMIFKLFSTPQHTCFWCSSEIKIAGAFKIAIWPQDCVLANYFPIEFSHLGQIATSRLEILPGANSLTHRAHCLGCCVFQQSTDLTTTLNTNQEEGKKHEDCIVPVVRC